jgi:hypothetical protein
MENDKYALYRLTHFTFTGQQPLREMNSDHLKQLQLFVRKLSLRTGLRRYPGRRSESCQSPITRAASTERQQHLLTPPQTAISHPPDGHHRRHHARQTSLII